jgi:uncharacterized MAPEG superfamily protein
MSSLSSKYDRAAARFNGRLMSMAGGMCVAVLVSAAIWLATYWLPPQLMGMVDPVARLVFALKCISVAVLLCFLTGTEAIAHERLQSDAFDPLAGHQTQRLAINLRYLQNTLEQTIIFVPGLLGLAIYASDGHEMFAVVADAVVWILARFTFWICYHQGPQYRIFGLVGAAQSMLVLLYVSYRLGSEIAGPIGGAAPVLVFIAIEIFLVLGTYSQRDLTV